MQVTEEEINRKTERVIKIKSKTGLKTQQEQLLNELELPNLNIQSLKSKATKKL